MKTKALAVIVLVLIAFGAGLIVGHRLSAVKTFYAGVYALCFDTSGSVTTCENTVRHLYHGQRHKSPSPGFDWPPLETANDDH